MTYDRRQIEKPRKRCPKCGREWFMLNDVCMECADPYALRKAHAQRLDAQGHEMNAGD